MYSIRSYRNDLSSAGKTRAARRRRPFLFLLSHRSPESLAICVYIYIYTPSITHIRYNDIRGLLDGLRGEMDAFNYFPSGHKIPGQTRRRESRAAAVVVPLRYIIIHARTHTHIYTASVYRNAHSAV